STWPLVAVPLLLLVFLRSRSVPWPRWRTDLTPERVRRALGGLWWIAAGATVAWLALTVAFPLARLAGTTRTWTELPGAALAGRRALFNSVGTAAISATVIAGAALLSPRMPLRMRGPRWLWLPFLLPGVFTGVALIALFNRPWTSAIYQSVAILVLALSVRYAALGGSLVSQARATADPALMDAAASLGATPARVFRDAVWPQVAPGAASAWYLVYLLCLWDVETVVLIQPPAGETLALRLFNLLHYGHAAQVNALCVLLLAAALMPGILWLAGRTFFKRLLFGIASLALVMLPGCQREAGSGAPPLVSERFSRVTILGSRGVAPGQFNKPRSLTCDREDNLYVADLTGRIQKFSPEGRYLLQWQMPETDLGKPKGMGLDRDGNILVIEPHYMRVNHFTPDGRRVAQWGIKGTNAGEFILPRGIAQDSRGEFFVSEYTVVDRLQRFSLGAASPRASGGFPCIPVDAEGTSSLSACLTAAWGSPGDLPGQFNRAEGIAAGPDDAVYVADSCNHRIQVFDRDGKFLRSHGRAGSHPGEYSYPYDIRVASDGTQFVCEFGNSRITVLDAQDRVLEVLGGAGAGPGRFANPWSIALDSKGNLYVADSQNHRVQKFHRK
ncbi:MAG: hypothetical protein KIT22_03655, partial [Verrucomicrobiae bacterium]|nr:hypothetical protein [Verrucomicrobiae bacterium]